MAVLFVGFTWLGSIFVAPVLRVFVRSRSGTNDIVGNILSSFGVLYGILLGLTAVAAYQNWSDVQTRITQEAGALLSLHADVSSFPDPARNALNEAMINVLRVTIEEEWEQLREGQVFTGTGEVVGQLRADLVAFSAQGPTQAILHEQAIMHLNEYVEHRRLRAYSVTQGIPAVFWYVVIIGAVFNIVLIWLLDMKLVTQFFLGGLLAFYLGAIILMIARLDQPFFAKDGVSPEAFRLAYQYMVSR
ncbi:MAG: hypothetical protein V2I76_11455 [Roseobacter sp.]|jgi:hypothetical protein|nr:hypothetical protein [Roseobacter sp.]